MSPPSQVRSSGRARRLGTSLILLVVAALMAGVLWVVGQERGWFTPGRENGTAVREEPLNRRAGLEQALTVRADAMRDKDRARWLSVLDPADPSLHQAQGTIFDNMGQVAFDLVGYEYTGESPLATERQALLGPDAWVATVNLSYRIAAADTASVRREQYVTMVLRDRQWYVAGFDDHPGDTQPVQDLWELGPVSVTRGARSLVLSDSTGPQDGIAARTDRGAGLVDEVWGTGWPRTVVVVVPSAQEHMVRLLGRTDDAGLDQIAAVTTGEVGLTYTGVGADRIIVNPSAFERLDGTAAQMVMTHEITHVATRSEGGGEVPIWFSEGFADYVAFQGTGLSTWQRAGDVLNLVRNGQVPATLPDRDAFDPARGDVAPAYSASYLAVQLMADSYGQDQVLELYRLVQGTDTRDGVTVSAVPIDAAMRQVLGVDLASFEEQWRTHLIRTAAGSR